MHAAIARVRTRRGPQKRGGDDCGCKDSSSSEGSVRGDEDSLEDRRIGQDALDERAQTIREQGMPVRLFLRELPEDDSLYNPRKHAEFVEDHNHPDGGYWHEAPPVLLWIELKPLSGFRKLRERRRRHSDNPYHLPLCYADEMHRFDLSDWSAGMRLARRVYERLRAKYDGREVLLHGWMQGTTLTLSRRTTLGNASGANLVDDTDLRMFRAAGSYQDRDLQIAL